MLGGAIFFLAFFSNKNKRIVACGWMIDIGRIYTSVGIKMADLTRLLMIFDDARSYR